MKIKDMPENTKEEKDEKTALLARAKAVGLDANATEEEVETKESEGDN